jgi:peptidoglycan/LPS O-acetylase OafA/YrhL
MMQNPSVEDAGTMTVTPLPTAINRDVVSASGSQVKRRIQIVEAARGAAALYVMVGHLFWTVFEVTGSAGPLFRIFRYGHEAVILFFLLSGFSIHYTYSDRALHNLGELKKYLIGRLRRIYPVFLFAFILTVALGAFATWLSPKTLMMSYETSPLEYAAQLLFLTDLNEQGTWFRVPAGNAALWSLSYEVAYYLVYPLFWLLSRKLRPAFLLGSAVALGLLNEAAISAGFNNHFSKVFGFYWIWCAGAVCAQLLRTQVRPLLNGTGFLLALAVALISVCFFDTLPWRRFKDWLWAMLFALLFFGYLSRFTHVRKFLGVLLITIVTIAAAVSAEPFALPGSRSYLFAKLATAWALCIYLLGHPAERLKRIGRSFLRFKATASYSYALYAIHLPILLFIVDVLLLLKLHPFWAALTLPLIMWLANAVETTVTTRYQEKDLAQGRHFPAV